MCYTRQESDARRIAKSAGWFIGDDGECACPKHGASFQGYKGACANGGSEAEQVGS